ncbi:MFS transporter [Acetobacteraceae bacterium KSS8]|uniref:MFS transporter n=1 Tax=Endosaccharibacter trunci TaxID=2812733 RepID=A0ABT1W538_9PROT|nr:MFS transporter [Acetobacteraceae bacterium KSS8]
MNGRTATLHAARDAVLSPIRTNIPARLDRLPWSSFHLLVVAGLGITWILDGLEVTIVGSIGPALQNKQALAMSVEGVGLAASFYLVGAVAGAVLFGWLTDRLGRKRIFSVTLGLYIVSVLATAVAWNSWSFILFRCLTGIAIGGEYAAINSAIDELVPAKLRGRIDLMVNGSYWIGAAVGAAISLFLLQGRMGVAHGWRFGFAVGGVLGFGVLLMRHWVPESPRWLLTHGHRAQAETVTAEIEHRCSKHKPGTLPPVEKSMVVHPRRVFGFGLIWRAMIGQYKVRSGLALLLMAAQAFLYNAVFFTYGQVLTHEEGVSPSRIGLFILPLAVGNLIGPLLLGSLFDTIGRRKMIFATYGVSGLLMTAVALLFAGGHLTATTQTIGWVAIFFFASPAASAAYLTASEIFPLETRALAISMFYVLGTLIGGVGAPYLFGVLIGMDGRWPLSCGYLGAAILMILAGAAALFFGVDAEGKSLEDIAAPLSEDGASR